MIAARYTPERVARLHEVFDLVKNAEHWKLPIDALVPVSKATREELVDAVVFFCGGLPMVTRHDEQTFRVEGDGYYAWVGA